MLEKLDETEVKKLNIEFEEFVADVVAPLTREYVEDADDRYDLNKYPKAVQLLKEFVGRRQME